MRTFIIPIIILILLVTAGIFEDIFLRNSVDKCTEIVDTIIEKTENGTAKTEDVTAFSELWDDTKSRLHSIISHAEIRDVDLWLSEAKSLVASGNFELARSKLVVVKDKIQAIPETFKLTFGNA